MVFVGTNKQIAWSNLGSEVALFLLFQHLLTWKNDLVDKEAPQLACYCVATFVFSLLLFAVSKDLLYLVSLETDLAVW